MLTRKDMNKLVSLLYLLSVSQNASKRKASEKLDTSIDTINKYLGDLEQDLGSKLLASNGRGTQTTPEALEILPLGQTLKSILREVEFLATKIPRFREWSVSVWKTVSPRLCLTANFGCLPALSRFADSDRKRKRLVRFVVVGL